MMCCERDTAELLHRLGRRLTPQRLLIVSALRHAEGHLTAGAVLERAQDQFPCIDASTVYRTLQMLAELRLAVETHIAGDDVIYEWATDPPHHHLICRRCGQIARIDGAPFERIARELRREHGFVAELDHLVIHGTCRGCVAAGTQPVARRGHE